MQLKYLAEEMQAITKGLEKVVQELSMSENDGPVSENFRKVRISVSVQYMSNTVQDKVVVLTEILCFIGVGFEGFPLFSRR